MSPLKLAPYAFALLPLFAACQKDSSTPTPANDGGLDTGSADALDTGSADKAGEAGPPAPIGFRIPATHPSDFVFDGAKLSTWTITLGAAEEKKLQETAWDEVYVPGMLKVDGEDVGKVGVRYKGQFGGWVGCFGPEVMEPTATKKCTAPLVGMCTRKLKVDAMGNNAPCSKISYKISFNEYERAKKFHSLKKVKLHSMWRDPSLMRERLSHKLFRDMGILTSRAVHAKVIVNDKYKGIFGLTEDINGDATDYWFPARQGNGNLYKEVWPTTEDPKYYVGAPQTAGQRTNEPDPTNPTRVVVPPDKIINFYKALTGPGADVGKVANDWLDTTYMTRYLAVSRAITDFDGFTAFYALGNHNFYIYENPLANKLYVMPWDLEGTWSTYRDHDTLPEWYQAPAQGCPYNYKLQWGGEKGIDWASCDKVFQAIAKDDGVAKYNKAIVEMLEKYVTVEKVNQDLDTWFAQIKPAIMGDPLAVSEMAMTSNIQSVRNAVPNIREKLRIIAEGKDPVTFLVKTTGVNDFEKIVNPLSFGLSARALTNSGTSAKISLNEQEPLAGTKDARLDFMIRNPTPPVAFGQWAYMRFYMEQPVVDLSGFKQMKIRIKSDKPRMVRVELEGQSGRYKDPPMAGRRKYGWDIMATPAGVTATLDFSALAVPAWTPKDPAPPTTVDGERAAVVANTDFIFVVALPVDRDPVTGLQAMGVTDAGFIQADNIEFVK